ncbi:PREDICTED: filament-like plant protein 4 [Populus euphratica]|uniref:Filament-like plant protein 4 n=1 Tax=Populus euphratica TaxID=75702 RepID=A0AAJ6UFL1_POPEU|nr:PREDICTED: filament-like plant protein 4 [Populus euphratica]XP_011028983.1 PREDICTED: filament-like plant protein 4 [Populus euphratica]
MDRRSWPWKKKSSDKTEKAAPAEDSGGSQGEKDSYKKPNYVQISVESYTHLTGLEDQVKTYGEQVETLEDQIMDLNEKLSAAHSEMTTKENLVKQHAKVAEEAVSGWEKAEAEALALKNHLETVTLSKLTAEDRASHLDGALKECMRQIRNLKEEHEQKMQEVVLNKKKQLDKIKMDFEAKIANLDQELLRSAAENAALSRSLQERSNMLIKISEERSQAEADIELLKSNIESCEREINSLKYELHVISKELEIRNEEKNMIMRSAEAANKQHTEGVKKIAKLEAECQRLRGLVRKKLPGPAALAQMKLEVESLGRDYGDSRLRRSPVKPPSPHLSSVPEFSLDNVQKFNKENEFLTERLFAVEEETKMLKEALAKRNSELQASRNLCAKTASKLQSLEAQFQINNNQKSSPKSITQVPAEGYSSQNISNPPSLTSVSEDGNDDTQSCADSWATTSVSEVSNFKKDNHSDKSNKAENAKHLELMDDFLEMEKFACLNADSATPISSSPNNKASETANTDALAEVSLQKDALSEEKRDLDPLVNHAYCNKDSSAINSGSDADLSSCVKLQSRISMLLESVSKEIDVDKILEEIKQVVHDAETAASCGSKEVHHSDATCERQTCPEDAVIMGEKEITLLQESKAATHTMHTVSEELLAAISQIHDFVLLLGKEAMAVHDTSCDSIGLSQKIEEFSVTFKKVLCSDRSLIDFMFDLSRVLALASGLRFNVLGYKCNEAEISSPDCIDKVALPENKVIQNDSLGETFQNGCANISSPTSNPEVPDYGNLVPGYGSNTTSCKVSLEEFEELKSEKDNMAMDLARCTENFEMTKSQLHETEQLLAEVKSQLVSAKKSNSLAETQLKCMAESYRSLETRAQELETEVNLLRVKTETLESELQGEKTSHQDALTRCKELEEQLQTKERSSADDIDLKSKQEKEITAAAEKLAECQETIFLLGKQLKYLRPQTEFMGSPYSERSQSGDGIAKDEPTVSGINLQDSDQAEMDTGASVNFLKAGSESPSDSHNNPCCPSDTESNLLRSPVGLKHPKHRPTKSTSSSSSSTPTPEKHPRGFSRFFSSKGKDGY